MKRSFLLNHLLLIIITTITMLLIYATVQQSYRTAANDPQIQLAEDISTKIQQGKSIENIFKKDTFNISQSLAPFITLYNASALPIQSTGYLNEKMPQPPEGIFEVAKKNGQHQVTWRPQSDVRMALVLIHIKSAPVEFVVVGRSLRETEYRESDLRKMVFIAWIICLVVILLSVSINYYKL